MPAAPHRMNVSDISDQTARPAGKAQGIALIAVTAMPTLALAGLVPDLPQLFQHFATVPDHELLVPMIITAPALCVALFSGATGLVADKWGRRPLLLVALLTFSLLGLMPMFFSNLKAIIASRVAVGVAEAAILTVGNALLGDYFQTDDRKKWLGYQNMFGSIFGSTFLLCGGFLADWHWNGPFLLYLIGLAVLALVYFTCWEPHTDLRSMASGAAAAVPANAADFPWRTTFWVCGVTVALSLVYFVQAVQHGRIFGDLGVASPGRISLLVTIASMGTVIGGYLFKRYPSVSVQAMLALSLVAYGVAYVGVAWAPNLTVGLPLDMLGQIGGGIMLPTLIAWSLSKYDFDHRGRGMGLWGGAFFLGAFVSPPVLTMIGKATPSFLASVGTAGALCLLTAAVMIIWNRRAAPAATV
jgi:MFS family permease